MAKKKLITEIERTKIAIAYNQHRDEKAEFIRQVASELCGRELGLSTVQRELAKLRREHPRGSTDPIDDQWSIASCKDYPASAQAIPFLLYIQYTWEDNIPDAFKEYKKRKGEKIASTLTNRLAIWISRLMPLLGTDPRATEDEDNKIWTPPDVSQKNLNKWPAWIDDFVHIAGAYASYEIGCELAGVKPINTICYDAPTLEQIKLNIIMYNKPFLESKKPETIDEKLERFESIKVEDIVRKGGKHNARSHNITKRGKDSYTIVLNLGRDPETGKRKQQWISVKGTKKEAEKRLSELLNQLDSGIYVKPGKSTLAEFLKLWLRDYAKPNLSPKGFERYESIVRVHLISCLGNIVLTKLRPEHVQKYYTAKLNSGLNARTVRYHHVVLHIALKTAVKWGLISRNVADAVDPPRTHNTEMNTWDEDSIISFLNTVKNTPYYALFHTALFTGMRRSELLALRWQDIDFIFSQISVSRGLHQLNNGSYIFTQPKSAKSQRTIALSPSAILVLKEHHEKQKLERIMQGIPLTDDDLVFSHPNGKPMRPNTVSRAWTILAVHAGLKVIRFHDARHSHASLMLKQGAHPKIVQERLGHSTISVTLDTYSHVAPGLQEAAANRFDEAITTKYNKTANEITG